MHGETIALGPGKADLLEAIARTGTIRKAAAALEMSYMRAWNLIRTMNDAFDEPLVLTERGGSERGHSQLSDRGIEVLRLYREMEHAAEAATRETWRQLRRLMKR